MPSLIVYCFVIFGPYSWEAWSFLKENKWGGDLGDQGVKVTLRGVVGGETVVRML